MTSETPVHSGLGVELVSGLAILVLALSACSRTGTIEGDVYIATQDGEVMRGTGARVYLVPEKGDRQLWATLDTLCLQARNWQQYSTESRRAAIESAKRFWERKADSLAREAEGLPAAERTTMLRHSELMLVDAYDREERYRLDLMGLPMASRAATNWLRRTLQLSYASASVDSAKADVDGHYVLGDVPRGSYALFALPAARITDAEDILGWRTMVEVPGGVHTQQLDNDARLTFGVMCHDRGESAPLAGSN
jgi:hypothetical protein